MGPPDTDWLPCLVAQLPDPGTGSPVILLGLTFLIGVKDWPSRARWQSSFQVKDNGWRSGQQGSSLSV